jgi:hypothetical protein
MRCALILTLALTASGCYPRGAGLFAAVAGTAIVTAAIVSAMPPPPPRVVYVPEPRPGYVWQTGYWMLQGQEWVWIDGQWLPLQPGYRWSPTHWEAQPDGTWKLFPGQWVPESPPQP